MGVIGLPPFEAVQPIKEHQSELQRNCRDYRDTFKEFAGTTRTLSRRVQGLQGHSDTDETVTQRIVERAR
jgi:hypothetical protein